MATAYTATSYSTETAVSKHGGNVLCRRVTFEAATALIINDTIKFFKVPKNAKPLDFWLAVDDLDSGTDITITARLSDGTTTDNFFAASTVGQAGGLARCDLLAALEHVTETDDYYVEALIVAAPTVGLGTLVACLTYTMDLETGE